jgi:Holliday junction resolvase RusA-like endonuclease
MDLSETNGDAPPNPTRLSRRSAVLPAPPSVNHAYVRSAYGVRLTPQARAWREAVQYAVPRDLLTGSIAVRIDTASGRSDLDNGIKAILDALNGIWWEDDRSVSWLMARRVPSHDADAVTVTAWSIGGPATPTTRRRRKRRSPWAILLAPPRGG